MPGGNTSIGLEQAEVLRRVNRALGRRLSLPGPYTTLVKGAFAHGVLSRRPGTKLLLGGEDLEYARKRSAEIVDRLRDAGYDVVGDLADLTVPLTDTGPETTTARQVPDAEVLLRESIEATADLLVELQGRVEQWQQERTDLRDKLREARAVSPGRRVSSPGRAAVSRARNGLSRITGRHR